MPTTTDVHPTTTHTIEARGPFSLALGERFLGGMLAITSRPSATADHLHLAFVPDGRAEGAVGVCVRPSATGVTVTVDADDPGPIVGQVARILSLDLDAAGFVEVGDRDPVIGNLQARLPGLRPVNFLSPYEAGAKFLIGHRIRMAQAGSLKQRLSRDLGEPVVICGEEHHAFPGPGRLVELGPTPGLSDAKVRNLRALAEAALTSDLLDATAIRSRPAPEAVAALQVLPGVGPFTAEGIVIRGAGAPDLLATHEGRLAGAAQRAYGLTAPPTDEQFATIAEAWRPFRSWTSVLLRVALEAGELPPA